MKKEIMKKLPQVKKTINAFLIGEEGKISKQSIIKAGIILGVVSLGALGVQGNHSSNLAHSNSLSPLTYSGTKLSATHSNGSNHANHSNASSPTHSSHSNAVEQPPNTTHGSHSNNGWFN
jgi:hypothetical protein